MNRVEMLDIDTTTESLRGQQFFSLFSPVIGRYSVTTEPGLAVGGTWADLGMSRAPLDRWTAGNNSLIGFSPMGNSPSGALFGSGGYAYSGPEPVSIVNAPIRIWSVKSFMSQWLAKAAPGLIEAKLRRGDLLIDQTGLVGSVTSRLNMPLENAWLLSNEYAFELGLLRPGNTVTLDLAKQRPLNALLTENNSIDLDENSDSPANQWREDFPFLLNLTVSSREKAGGTSLTNQCLATWSLKHLLDAGKVVLIGEISEPASKLWINSPPIPGHNDRPLLVSKRDYVSQNSDGAESEMIETRDLTKMYGELYAVNRLNNAAPQGRRLRLHWAEWAGKTTTMRMLRHPSQSDARRGDGVRLLELHRSERNSSFDRLHAGFFGVYDDMKVIDISESFAAAYRIKGPCHEKNCEDCLELVDLTYKREALVTGLSRGMTQRLGLARACFTTAGAPSDEPASGLYPRARIEIRGLLKELRSMGKRSSCRATSFPNLPTSGTRSASSSEETARQRSGLGCHETGPRPYCLAHQHRRPEIDAFDLLKQQPNIHGVKQKEEFLVVRINDPSVHYSFIPTLLLHNGFRLRLFRERTQSRRCIHGPDKGHYQLEPHKIMLAKGRPVF